MVQLLVVGFSVYGYFVFGTRTTLELVQFILALFFLVCNAIVAVLGFQTFGWQVTRIVG